MFSAGKYQGECSVEISVRASNVIYIYICVRRRIIRVSLL